MKVDLIQSDCVVANHARWRVVHELFERLRHAPRNVWHAELNAVAPGDPALAYEVLSLLVADESVEESQVES